MVGGGTRSEDVLNVEEALEFVRGSSGRRCNRALKRCGVSTVCTVERGTSAAVAPQYN